MVCRRGALARSARRAGLEASVAMAMVRVHGGRRWRAVHSLGGRCRARKRSSSDPPPSISRPVAASHPACSCPLHASPHAPPVTPVPSFSPTWAPGLARPRHSRTLQMFVFLAMGGANVELCPLSGFETGAQSQAQTFDVRACVASRAEEHARLLSFIEAASGTLLDFNEEVRTTLAAVLEAKAPAEDDAANLGSPVAKLGRRIRARMSADFPPPVSHSPSISDRSCGSRQEASSPGTRGARTRALSPGRSTSTWVRSSPGSPTRQHSSSPGGDEGGG
mmetsp:Transcript_14297/g.42046  ORF Transcript_14297/g.42046 Transcript_14297/m.42046 type:complete len:278 (+) Transcript_14297:1265-2098(+)